MEKMILLCWLLATVPEEVCPSGDAGMGDSMRFANDEVVL